MNNLKMTTKRSFEAASLVGKGLMVGALVSAAALTQASVVTDSSAGVGMFGGNEYFSEGSSSNGSMQVSFLTSANFSGAISAAFAAPVTAPSSAPTPAAAVPKPTITSVILAPAPIVSAPVLAALVPPVVTTQQIVAAAPAVMPVSTAQPAGPTQVVPGITALAVPEPGTVAMLLGGFAALIGVRRARSVSAKKG